MTPLHYTIKAPLTLTRLTSGTWLWTCLVCVFTLTGGQFTLALAVPRHNLEYAQQDQSADAGKEEGVSPTMSACDRIPSRPPTHDDLPDLLFVAGIAFLVGFKIAAWMSRRHVRRLREIWGK